MIFHYDCVLYVAGVEMSLAGDFFGLSCVSSADTICDGPAKQVTDDAG